MRNRYIVTGAAGFIGSWVVRELIKQRSNIVAVVRPDSDVWRLKEIASKIKIVNADLRNYSQVKELITSNKPAFVLHLATFGVYSYQQKEAKRIILGNYEMLTNLLEAVKGEKLKKFVNTGSVFEYGTRYGKVKEEDVNVSDILNKYSATKIATTALSVSYAGQIPILTLRPFTNYGPLEDSSRFIYTVIKNSIEGKEIRIAPNTVRDFIYVKDVARAFVLACKVELADGEIINIGSGEKHTLKSVANEIKAVVNSKSNIVEDKSFLRARDSRCWADISRAKKLLRWQPRNSRTVALKETTSWVKKQIV